MYPLGVGGVHLPALLSLLSLMNFWTPERCQSIDTLILMDNSCEMSMQAELTKSASRKAQLLKNVEMIQAELRTRN